MAGAGRAGADLCAQGGHAGRRRMALSGRPLCAIDDKPRLLDAIKRQWGDYVTTVFPRQGHYALDPDNEGKYCTPDVTLERIGDLNHLDLATLRSAARAAPTDGSETS